MNYGDRPLTIPHEDDATPESERAIRAITEAGLPQLRGTEPEVAFAANIRLQKLISADDYLTQLRNDEQETALGPMAGAQPSAPVSKSEVRREQAALSRLRHQDDASWWIARQDRTAVELLSSFLEGHEP